MGTEIARARGRIELWPIPSIPRQQPGGQRPPSDGDGRSRGRLARTKVGRNRPRGMRYSAANLQR